MRLAILLLMLPLVAGAVEGAPSRACARYTSTEAMDFMERAFVGATQIGDGLGTKDWEVLAGKNTRDKGADSADYVWLDCRPTPFTFSWKPSTSEVRLDVDGVVVTATVPVASDAVTDLFIKPRGTTPGGSTHVHGLIIDGISIPQPLRHPAPDSYEDLLQVGPPPLLADGFVLTGWITFDWEGDRPTRNDHLVEFLVGTTPAPCWTPTTPIPELPAVALALAGLGAMAAVAGVRRRS